jgi:hypothetical protein
MQTHFKHLCLKSFSMVQGSFESNDFWPLKPLFENVRDWLENVWAHSFTLSHTLKNVNVNPRLHS